MAEQRISSLIEFDDFFVIPRMFYKALGMTFCNDKDEMNRTSKMGVLLFSTTFLSINLCLFLEIVDMSDATIMDLTAVLPCFIFSFLGQCKIFVIWVNRKNVESLFRLMKQQFPTTTEGQRVFDVNNTLKNMSRLERLYLAILMLGVWWFNLLPFFWSIFEYFLNSSNIFVKRFPYYKWYPFRINNMWIYSAAYAEQMHTGVVVVNCFISADIFLISVISVLLMYFRHTQRQLREMIPRGDEDDVKNLKAIMNFHRITLIITKLTSSVFSPTLLFSFMSSILIICLAAFQTTAPEVAVIQLVNNIFFLLHELVQTSVICYLGQSLMHYVSNFTWR